MTTFLVLYNSPVPAAEMMAQVTPQQAQAGMDAWNAWAEKNGERIHWTLPRRCSRTIRISTRRAEPSTASRSW